MPLRDYPRFPQHPRAPYSYPGDEGIGGLLARRRSTRLTTGPLGLDGVVSGIFELRGTAGSMLLDLKTHIPQWFRLYANLNDLIADKYRDIDTLPPTTPIILDALFAVGTPEQLVASPLDRDLWVAGPGCTNSTDFSRCVDGSDVTHWDTPSNQVAGDTFSIDLGAPVIFRSIGLDSQGRPNETPTEFSIESSLDGTEWTMLKPSVAGYYTQLITFPADITAQYLRFVIITPKAAAQWAITEFNLYAEAENFMRLRLFNGDEQGIPAFNWDDRAKQQLYYNILVQEPERVGALFYETFESVMACYSAWFPVPTSDPGTYDPPTCSYAFNDIFNLVLPWLSAEWELEGGTRPRYYNGIANELRPSGTNANIARFYPRPTNKNITAVKALLRLSGDDSPTWGADFCAYLSNTSTVGAWNTLAHLRLTVARSAAFTGVCSIGWRNEAGSFNTLITGTPFSWPGTEEKEFVGIITIIDRGLPTEHVQATVYIDGVEECTIEVPDELVQLDNHDSVGWQMGHGSVDLSWGGVGAKKLIVYGANPGVEIDLGYVPIERPGGSLVTPL